MRFVAFEHRKLKTQCFIVFVYCIEMVRKSFHRKKKQWQEFILLTDYFDWRIQIDVHIWFYHENIRCHWIAHDFLIEISILFFPFIDFAQLKSAMKHQHTFIWILSSHSWASACMQINLRNGVSITLNSRTINDQNENGDRKFYLFIYFTTF